jgi:hypothetical protein
MFTVQWEDPTKLGPIFSVDIEDQFDLARVKCSNYAYALCMTPQVLNDTFGVDNVSKAKYFMNREKQSLTGSWQVTAEDSWSVLALDSPTLIPVRAAKETFEYEAMIKVWIKTVASLPEVMRDILKRTPANGVLSADSKQRSGEKSNGGSSTVAAKRKAADPTSQDGKKHTSSEPEVKEVKEPAAKKARIEDDALKALTPTTIAAAKKAAEITAQLKLAALPQPSAAGSAVPAAFSPVAAETPKQSQAPTLQALRQKLSQLERDYAINQLAIQAQTKENDVRDKEADELRKVESAIRSQLDRNRKQKKEMERERLRKEKHQQLTNNVAQLMDEALLVDS